MDRDLLYVNATFHTMNAEAPTAEALLVRDGRIAAIGRRDEVQSASRPGMETVDLASGTAIPGFNDSHAHILWLGMALEQIDVSVGAAKSIQDITRAVADRVRSTTPGEWVQGRGYDQNMLREKRHPTRDDLDSGTPDHPVVLRHTSGHVLTCNTAALQAAGITRSTPQPDGGVIEHDEHGEPTGVMKESAMDLIMNVVPPPTVEAGAAAIRRAMAAMASFGITSASDAATGIGPSIDSAFAMFSRAVAEDEISGRIQLMPQIHYVAPPHDDTALPPGEFRLDADPLWLSVGPVKIFSDGALSTRTAALREPYADDPTSTGILLWPKGTLGGMITRAHDAGWQIATHALGDRAVETVVRAYRAALDAHPRQDHRHRIEHCMLLDEPLARQIRDLGIVPSLQPDIFRLGDGYVTALGLDRASASIPVGTFRRLGVRVALSSDTPVIPCDPLAVIRSAVERRTPSGQHLGGAEASSVEEAVRAYTVGGAFATKTDNVKGALKVGMLADFTVLSGDPVATPVANFDTLKVTRTIIGGRQVYAA